jgi:hypothetical protein
MGDFRPVRNPSDCHRFSKEPTMIGETEAEERLRLIIESQSESFKALEAKWKQDQYDLIRQLAHVTKDRNRYAIRCDRAETELSELKQSILGTEYGFRKIGCAAGYVQGFPTFAALHGVNLPMGQAIYVKGEK